LGILLQKYYALSDRPARKAHSIRLPGWAGEWCGLLPTAESVGWQGIAVQCFAKFFYVSFMFRLCCEIFATCKKESPSSELVGSTANDIVLCLIGQGEWERLLVIKYDNGSTLFQGPLELSVRASSDLRALISGDYDDLSPLGNLHPLSAPPLLPPPPLPALLITRFTLTTPWTYLLPRILHEDTRRLLARRSSTGELL
jgi:hypothetical protein